MEVKRRKSDISQETEEKLALLVISNHSEPRAIRTARQVELRAMCETRLLASIQQAGLTEIAICKNVVENQTCKTAGKPVDVKVDLPFI